MNRPLASLALLEPSIRVMVVLSSSKSSALELNQNVLGCIATPCIPMHVSAAAPSSDNSFSVLAS
ncbi:hypothetical protein M422DRAFT_35403 [Sphaerobolus stellatus SS14]|uniref:Unplaced genomic scaffold SPHSTscaffold_134, whole genome shotgun sequence n=1 Tax=Sphaerobolus stellatus (strain SS14) TaxID=990650 RepID=A0A0C9V8Q0_SPHS4|nr:hypothetical protein M422DRAFT_35403 [Sphaerobolus stellatus SS14]